MAELQSYATFDDILDELETLSRQHHLVYRIQVGRTLLHHFYGGDFAAYASHDPNKEVRFAEFCEKGRERLERFGLSPRQAADSIMACHVFDQLPAPLAKALLLSQILELTRVKDGAERARLAAAAVQGDWSVRQLHDAVTAVNDGLPLDADAAAPGIQPARPDEDRGKPVAGRLVTQAVKLGKLVGQWTAEWQSVDASRLRGPQRQRLQEAVAALESRLAELKAAVGE